MDSRAKGKKGELEVVHLAREAGFHDARRTSDGRTQDGRGDIAGVGELHLEVKRSEQYRMEDWLAQARRECAIADVPVVAHRRSNAPWLATLPLPTLLAMYHDLSPDAALMGGFRRSRGRS